MKNVSRLSRFLLVCFTSMLLNHSTIFSMQLFNSIRGIFSANDKNEAPRVREENNKQKKVSIPDSRHKTYIEKVKRYGNLSKQFKNNENFSGYKNFLSRQNFNENCNRNIKIRRVLEERCLDYLDFRRSKDLTFTWKGLGYEDKVNDFYDYVHEILRVNSKLKSINREFADSYLMFLHSTEKEKLILEAVEKKIDKLSQEVTSIKKYSEVRNNQDFRRSIENAYSRASNLEEEIKNISNSAVKKRLKGKLVGIKTKIQSTMGSIYAGNNFGFSHIFPDTNQSITEHRYVSQQTNSSNRGISVPKEQTPERQEEEVDGELESLNDEYEEIRLEREKLEVIRKIEDEERNLRRFEIGTELLHVREQKEIIEKENELLKAQQELERIEIERKNNLLEEVKTIIEDIIFVHFAQGPVSFYSSFLLENIIADTESNGIHVNVEGLAQEFGRSEKGSQEIFLDEIDKIENFFSDIYESLKEQIRVQYQQEIFDNPDYLEELENAIRFDVENSEQYQTLLQYLNENGQIYLDKFFQEKVYTLRYCAEENIEEIAKRIIKNVAIDELELNLEL